MKPKYSGLIAAFCMSAWPVAAQASPASMAMIARQQATRREIIRNLADQGLESFHRRQYASAIMLLQKAAELDTRSAVTHFNLGQAYYYRAFSHSRMQRANLEDARAAVAAYEKAKAIDPKLGSIPSPYLLYHGLAMCYEAVKNHDGALVALGLAMRLAPKNPMPPLYSARVRYATGDINGSNQDLVESFHRARQLGSHLALARLIRRDASFSKLIQASQNRVLVRSYESTDRNKMNRALAMNPRGEPEIYHDALAAKTIASTLNIRRHRSSQSTNVSENAQQLSMTAALMERSAPDAHYRRALAYSMAGKFSQAMRSLRHALEASAASPRDLRRILLLAKTDRELDPLRDWPDFWKLIRSYSERLGRHDPARTSR